MGTRAHLQPLQQSSRLQQAPKRGWNYSSSKVLSIRMAIGKHTILMRSMRLKKDRGRGGRVVTLAVISKRQLPALEGNQQRRSH
jgi:hypothetical protein